jgi:hypothetical protein
VLLAGNINTIDFIRTSESVAGLVIVTVYAVLVVIGEREVNRQRSPSLSDLRDLDPAVMLNLLISIVGTVYAETMEHRDTEFVKAKAQILNEMEQTYFVNTQDRGWFPDKASLVIRSQSLARLSDVVSAQQLYFVRKVHDSAHSTHSTHNTLSGPGAVAVEELSQAVKGEVSRETAALKAQLQTVGDKQVGAGREGAGGTALLMSDSGSSMIREQARLEEKLDSLLRGFSSQAPMNGRVEEKLDELLRAISGSSTQASVQASAVAQSSAGPSDS